MAKFIGLTRDEYLKEAKSLISLAEGYLNSGDLEKAEEYLRAALGALKCARKVKG
jgi:Tfp pilus assembly protein PilF